MSHIQHLDLTQEQKKLFQQQKSSIKSHITLQDLYHILYLKPIECVLDQRKGGLAIGLKIVDRKSQTQYELKQVKPLLSYKDFEQCSSQIMLPDKQRSYLDYIREQKADNLLCQMKMKGNLQMAICVCMYNQKRQMLNNTLSGIGQNIINLYKQGVDPDKIVVILLQDGIQKMNSQIVEMFHVLQSESSIKFNLQKKKGIDHLINKINKLDQNTNQYGWQGEDSYLDMNSFLFDQQEQKKRNQLRFINIKQKYDQIKNTLSQINLLSKRKNPTPQDLPPKALQIFKKQCQLFMTKDIHQENNQFNLQQYYQTVINQFPSKIKPLVQNAISKTKQYCQNYINSRSQMSHVSFFRTNQYFPIQSGFSIDEIQELKEVKRKLLNKNISQQQKQQLQKKYNTNLKEINKILSIKMNIFFVIKYRNNQKLSSHNWFFNGFCKQFSNWQPQTSEQLKQDPDNNNFKAGFDTNNLSPKYTILLDVGLKPQAQALCKMYNAMVRQKDIGGVCGYMGLKIQKYNEESQRQLHQKIDFFSSLSLNFVDIQRAQQIEYHFAHLIDKGFQSIFKFIHVLPGAFSGYNMKAIWGINQDRIKKQEIQQQGGNADKLLQSYFKSINDKLKNQEFKQYPLSIIQILCRILLPDALTKLCISPVQQDSHEHLLYDSNVYLAEDRILCMGIHKNGFDLVFLPDAYSFVDPVGDIHSLMGQRKRWINGSYFAFQKVSSQFRQIGCCQALSLQIWYLAFMNMLAFVAPGFFMFSISVAMQVVRADILAKYLSDLFEQTSQIFKAFVYTINFFYGMLILGLIYFSINLDNRNDKFIKFVYALSTILGTMSLVMMVILVVDLARGLTQGSSYLIANQVPQFIQSIPGGQQTVDIIRYIVLGIMGLYAVPILFYSILFCNIRVIFQILLGAVSFTFYSPTYLIILNIYAICRMDDLSWGTKGLQAGSGEDKDTKVLTSWKIIKTIHVAKLVFWNVIVAGLLIHFGSNYLVRFYLTFALMVLIASTMAIKVVLAILYYFQYKWCVRTSPQVQISQDKINLSQPSLYTVFVSKQGQINKMQQLVKEQIDINIQKVQQSLIDLKNSVDPDILFKLINLFQTSTSKQRNGIISEDLKKMNKYNLSRRRGKDQSYKNLRSNPQITQTSINILPDTERTPIKSFQHDQPFSSQKLMSQKMEYSPFNENAESRGELLDSSAKKSKYNSKLNISLAVDEVQYEEKSDKKKTKIVLDKIQNVDKIESKMHNSDQINGKLIKGHSTLQKFQLKDNQKLKEEDQNEVSFFSNLMQKFTSK